MDEFYTALGKRIAEYHAERGLPLVEETIAPLRHIGDWAREWLSMNNPLIGEEKLAKFASETQRLLTESQLMSNEIATLREALEYVVRHKDTAPQLTGIILDECATVCKKALSETKGD